MQVSAHGVNVADDIEPRYSPVRHFSGPWRVVALLMYRRM
jgi:hypothetical protein